MDVAIAGKLQNNFLCIGLGAFFSIFSNLTTNLRLCSEIICTFESFFDVFQYHLRISREYLYSCLFSTSYTQEWATSYLCSIAFLVYFQFTISIFGIAVSQSRLEIRTCAGLYEHGLHIYVYYRVSIKDNCIWYPGKFY